MALSRRTLFALAGTAALPRLLHAELPDAEWSAAAHARLGAARAQASRLGADERATIAAVADAILPRTDTPGALDVQVPQFIDLLIAEWLPEAEREGLRRGIAELEAHAVTTHGAGWAALREPQRQQEIAWGESREGTPSEGQRAFRRLKGWTVHGWMTSERVRREVFRVRVVPGEYRGCAPLSAGEDV